MYFSHKGKRKKFLNLRVKAKWKEITKALTLLINIQKDEMESIDNTVFTPKSDLLQGKFYF